MLKVKDTDHVKGNEGKQQADRFRTHTSNNKVLEKARLATSSSDDHYQACQTS